MSLPRVRVALLFGIAVCCSGGARAEEPPADTKRADPASVYRVSLWLDGAVIVGANAVTIGFYALGSGLIDERCPCDRQEVNSFDRGTIGNRSDLAAVGADATVAAAVAVPLALDYWALRRWGPVLEDATVLAEALSVNGALVSIAKHVTGRPFPRTYEGDPELETQAKGYRSFYSGHTSSAFAVLSVMAMTVGRRYQAYVVPWAVVVLVGAATAAQLVAAGWHFPTDTLVGAGAGTLVGVGTARLHFRDAPLRPAFGASADGAVTLGVRGAWP